MNGVLRVSSTWVGGKRDDWQVGVGVVTRARVEPRDWRDERQRRRVMERKKTGRAMTGASDDRVSTEWTV